MNRIPRSRKCAVCAAAFQPARPLQKVCDPTCGAAWARKLAERKCLQDKRIARKEAREAREKVKSRADHLREAQAAFNAWIKIRDADRPCISCKRPATWGGQWDAGHYLSRGARPELRFEPKNVWKQCLPCNRHLSGNLVLFRASLVKEIGIDGVEWLEGHHDPKRYTIEQLKEIKAHYRAEARRLKSAVNSA